MLLHTDFDVLSSLPPATASSFLSPVSHFLRTSSLPGFFIDSEKMFL
jgi:hypothetical protein